MQNLPWVLLKHTRRGDTHYDVMFGVAEGTDLWTIRVSKPVEAWLSSTRLVADVLAMHRRAYLSEQGSLSGGRGSVVRVGRGSHTPSLWTTGRRVTMVKSPIFQGRFDIRPLAPGRLLIRCD